MSAPLQADAARAVASGIASTDDDALYRRIGARIVPFLFICYIVSILDRSNIGFAQLQMRQDLGLTDAMYSLGSVLFFVGYVLFEVPSNALLRRFGARTFARIMFLWGAVSVAMITVDSAKHFYVLRFLLGLFEAGFFPGVVFYLTYWYPARRRASVLSIFYAGVAVAGMVGGLLSGWLMRGMSGVLGLHGWQWMFAIEGAPAILLGVMAGCAIAPSRRAGCPTPTASGSRPTSPPTAPVPGRRRRIRCGRCWPNRAPTCSHSSISR